MCSSKTMDTYYALVRSTHVHAVNAALYIKVLEGVGVRVLLNWQHTWLVMISFKLKLLKTTRQLNGGMTLKR